MPTAFMSWSTRASSGKGRPTGSRRRQALGICSRHPRTHGAQRNAIQGSGANAFALGSRIALRASGNVALLPQPQQLDRILLQDQRTHFRPDVDRLEILEPAVRRYDRIIGAEQHLVL